MFWKSRETEKDPLVYGDKFEEGDYDYHMWGDYRRSLKSSEPVEQSVSDPKQKMINIKPLEIHTQSTLSSPSWTVNSPEYNRIEIEYSPATRIKNYFDSLSQDQCTKLINKFGKMVEEL